MPPRWPIGQCRVCLGWGEKPQYADCGACSSWRQLHPDQAPCRRCGHGSHVNTDGLCRLCLLTIRLGDPEWIAHPVGGRPSQLMLILPGDRLPRSQPLDRPIRGRAPDRSRPRSLLDQLRIASAEPVDDPRICPPAIRGQLLLFRPRRQLTDAHAHRIKHRDLAGYDRLKDTAIAFAAERGLSTAWWRAACLMLRLVLAVRESDGDDLIPEETLDDLPRFRNAVAGVLRHGDLTSAGLLRPRRRSRPVVLPRPQRSCTHCDCWGSRTICSGCSAWKHQPALHPVDDCTRCRRPAVPLLDGLCRACCLHIDRHGPGARTQAWTQLWLGGDLAPSLAMRTGKLGYVAPQQKARAKAAARRPPAPPIWPHLIAPGQGVLFGARRDWSCFAKGTLDQLPSLTPAAQALLEDFRQHVEARGLDEQVRRIAARSLRILLAWIGAEAPIPRPISGPCPPTGAAPAPGTSWDSSSSAAWSPPTLPGRPASTSKPSNSGLRNSPPPSPANYAAGRASCAAKAAVNIARCRSRRSANTSATWAPSWPSGPARSPACGRSPETTSAPSSYNDQGSPAWTWPARCAAYSRRSSRNGSSSATPPAGSPRQQSYAFPSRSPPTGSAA